MNAEDSIVERVYQLKITLKGSKPPIWRRVLVSPDVTLARLHLLIQSVMPWGNCHLHEFRSGGNYYGVPDGQDEDDTTIAERLVSLARIAPSVGTRFTYVYDFGDDWQHDLRVEDIVPAKAGLSYPVCVAGKQRCPPENSGSLWGYYDKLELLNHPEHPEYANTKEWLGPAWDPACFDLEAANALLRDCFGDGTEGRRKITLL